MNYEVEKAKALAEEGNLLEAKSWLEGFLYKKRNRTEEQLLETELLEARLLLNEIKESLDGGADSFVYSPKQQIKSLLIWAIIGTVIGIIIDISVEFFGFTWLGCGFGCALDQAFRHDGFHKKHENIGCFLVGVLTIAGPIGVFIQFWRKKKLI